MTTKIKKKKKILWQKYIGMACFMLMGAVCGVLMAGYLDVSLSENRPIWQTILSLLGLFVLMYLAILAQLIIHEAGHLLFGLLSGYQFSSFRIMSFMWVKENDRIRLRRLSIAGTGGQCLMVPPELVDGKIPVLLYNLGGAFMNVIAGLIFLGLYFTFADIPFLSTVMLLFAIIGLALAVMNGVPMRMGTVDNDGYNAFSLQRSREALRSFWVQMKVNEQIAKGMRLRDMPEEWFAMPSDEDMKNSMIAVIGVFACNRLMDAQLFADADRLMAHLLEIDSGIVGLHRNLMICDRMYCELITGNRREVLEEMLSKEQRNFMKSMKKFPSVLRTEYVYALLGEQNIEKANQVKAKFEKCARTYPYPNDVQSERELMELAENVASETGIETVISVNAAKNGTENGK